MGHRIISRTSGTKLAKTQCIRGKLRLDIPANISYSSTRTKSKLDTVLHVKLRNELESLGKHEKITSGL
jgi:hypothetical protein